VTGTRPQEHWLDRLAAGYTRRQVLKAALAGAALTVPFLRPKAAFAGDSTSCRTGCLYSSHQQTSKTMTACTTSPQVTTSSYYLGYASLGLGFLAVPLAIAESVVDNLKCNDLAILDEKARNWDCIQPNCPGFDPQHAAGICENCSGVCCADQGVLNGYSCCSICSKSGSGCCYSVSGQC
jgi:hypothetical protein